MPRGQQHSDKKHRANKDRRVSTGEQQRRWGGLKPIITGPLGDAKHPTAVVSIAHHSDDKKRAA